MAVRSSFLVLLAMTCGCSLLTGLDDQDVDTAADDAGLGGRDLGLAMDSGQSEDQRGDLSMTDGGLGADGGQDMQALADLGAPGWEQNVVRGGESGEEVAWGPGGCVSVPLEGKATLRFRGNTAMEASFVTLQEERMRSSVSWERGPFELGIKDGRWSKDAWFAGESVYGRWAGVLDGPAGADQAVSFAIIPRSSSSTTTDPLKLGGWQKDGSTGFRPVDPEVAVNDPYAPEAAPLTLGIEVPQDGFYAVSLAAENTSLLHIELALRFDSQRFVPITLPPGTADEPPMALKVEERPLELYLSKGRHTVSLVSDAQERVRIKAVLVQATCTSLQDGPVVKGVFVAPGGRDPEADGSIKKPWALEDVLGDTQNERVSPGQTVWLRGGTYEGFFTATVSGTPGLPIAFRAYPGEFVRLDAPAPSPGTRPDEDSFVLTIRGDHTSWSQLEITSSQSGKARISSAKKGAIPSGIAVHGQDTTLSLLLLHDLAAGIRRGLTAGTGLLIEESTFYNLGYYTKVAGLDKPSGGLGILVQGSIQGNLSVRGNVFWGLLDQRAIVASAQDGQLAGVIVRGNVLIEQGLAFEGAAISGKTPGPYTIQDNLIWRAALELGLGVMHGGALVIDNTFIQTAVNVGGLASLTFEDNRFILDQMLPDFAHFIQVTPGPTSQHLIGGKGISIAKNSYQGGFRMRHGSGPDWSVREPLVSKDFKAWQAGGNDRGERLGPVSTTPLFLIQALANTGPGARYLVTVFMPKGAPQAETVELSQQQIPQLATSQPYRVINMLAPVDEDPARSLDWRTMDSGYARFPFLLPVQHLQKASLKGAPGAAALSSDYPASPEDKMFVYLIESL